jgi:hypothetical protein
MKGRTGVRGQQSDIHVEDDANAQWDGAGGGGGGGGGGRRLIGGGGGMCTSKRDGMVCFDDV